MFLKKRSFVLLIFVALFFVCDCLHAALPELKNPIEPRYYKGSSAEIMDFIKKKEKEVSGLKDEIRQIISRTTNEQDKRILNDALDFFQALTILYIKLQSQVKTPAGIVTKLPTIGSPPYDLKTFYDLIDLMGQIEKKLGEYEPKINVNEGELESLGDELKSLFSEYSILKEANPPRPDIFLKLGQIYTLQIKYAIVSLQLSRAKRVVEEAGKLMDGLKKLIRTTFQNLKITDDDVLNARKEYEKVSSAMNKQLSVLGKKAVNLNKKIVPYEMKLSEVLGSLKTTRNNDSELPILMAKQRYLEAAIEASHAKLEIINQKKLGWKLANVRAQFRYDWISTYANVRSSKSIKKFIREWYLRFEQIENSAEALKQQIVDIRSEEFEIMRKMTQISDEKGSVSDPNLLKTLSYAYRKLKEASSAVNDLFVVVSKNKELASDLKREVEVVLNLMKEKAGLVENVRVWSKRSFARTWQDIKVVLYYPLVTIGNSAITLNSILKIIVLLTIGIYLLRKGRRKLNEVLIKKTELAPGTIGSVTTLIYYTFLVLVVLVALSTAGINLNQLSIILGGLGVGIGFGLQNIANNFISGLILLIDRSIKVGDFIQLEDGMVGEVRDVAIRYAVVRTQNGEDIIVPNSEFVSQRVRNWTYGDNWRRLKIPFGVSYDSDPEQVVKLAMEAAREVSTTIEDYRHPIRVRFEGFGDNSINFLLRVWCRMTELRGDHGYVSDYYFALFRKFKEAGIEIPFPQRDVNIKNISPEIMEKLSSKGK